MKIKLIGLMFFFALSGCSTEHLSNNFIVDSLIDHHIGRGEAECFTIKSQCNGSNVYQEWENFDGTVGCSCDLC